MIRTSITTNPIARIIGHVEKDSERRELFAGIETAMIRLLQDSARAKGGRNFWAKVANSVAGEHDADSATVGATHFAAAHKQFGGRISAPGQGPMSTGAKYLTIPVNDQARGKSPREINDLFLAVRKDGAMFLFKNLGDGKTDLMYVLKKSVDQKPDPWLPSDQTVAAELSAAATAWLNNRQTQ